MTLKMSLVETVAGGPALSPVVAGTWRMAEWGWSAQERLAWIEGCLELGVSSFDHADVYGDYAVESLFGEALALRPSLRENVQLVSKCGIRRISAHRPTHKCKSYDTSSGHIVASVEASLTSLRTDRIDVLLLHRPDPLLDIDEVASAFDALRKAGKVLHFGVSNFAPRQFELLHSRTALATNQIELSPLRCEALFDGTLDQAQQLGVRPMVWSPLAGGRLFDRRDANARALFDTLSRIASSYGVATTTIAFAWVLRHPSRPLPVAGSRRIQALRDAAHAIDLNLDREAWYEILQAATGKQVL